MRVTTTHQKQRSNVSFFTASDPVVICLASISTSRGDVIPVDRILGNFDAARGVYLRPGNRWGLRRSNELRRETVVLPSQGAHSGGQMKLSNSKAPVRIAIAGASGFVGSALCRSLCDDYEIRALSRSERGPGDPWEWCVCNLYSISDCERALRECDVAIYLVHSMSMPSPLSQASFEDLDLILADNFARAASSSGVSHIIYLSGLIDEGSGRAPSQHLASRLEVERTLEAWGSAVTTLRAGLVVGPGGSSLKILTSLVRRLPLMITPRWTDSLTQPIALRDVIRAVEIVLDAPQVFRGPFDIGSGDVMSYREMMKRTAKVMGLSRPMIRVPFLSPRLSSLWVSLVTGCSRRLVAPLVQSLRHNMTVKPNPLQNRIVQDAWTFEASIQVSLEKTPASKGASSPNAGARARAFVKSARSVQRLTLPMDKDAHWVAREYLDWLHNSSLGFIRTQRDENEIAFFLRFFAKPLLEMRYSTERSFSDRALFYVHSGWLVSKKAPSVCRLEFRESRVGNSIIAAVHDFYPSLPWYIYRYSQAIAHLLVMILFGRHLRRVDARARTASSS